MWMNYLSRKHNIRIQHARNSQTEVKIGKSYVDGYCCETKTVYEYIGCYFHNEKCNICKQPDSKIHQRRAFRTREYPEFIRKSGYQLVTITDHDFDAWVEVIKMSLNSSSKLPPFYWDFGGARAFTTESIIRYVKEGGLFVFLEVGGRGSLPEILLGQWHPVGATPHHAKQILCLWLEIQIISGVTGKYAARVPVQTPV